MFIATAIACLGFIPSRRNTGIFWLTSWFAARFRGETFLAPPITDRAALMCDFIDGPFQGVEIWVQFRLQRQTRIIVRQPVHAAHYIPPGMPPPGIPPGAPPGAGCGSGSGSWLM